MFYKLRVRILYGFQMMTLNRDYENTELCI